jgi:hypothetical protein
MTKQPIHTIDHPLYMNMQSNLKMWAGNKKFVAAEAINTTENSYEFDQTAVMCFIIEHGK